MHPFSERSLLLPLEDIRPPRREHPEGDLLYHAGRHLYTGTVSANYGLGPWSMLPMVSLPMALLVILVVLLVRPQGIFGKPEVKRV